MATPNESIQRVYDNYMIVGQDEAGHDVFLTVVSRTNHGKDSWQTKFKSIPADKTVPSTIVSADRIKYVPQYAKLPKTERKDELVKLWLQYIDPHTANPIGATVAFESIPQRSSAPAKGSPYERFVRNIAVEPFEMVQVAVAIKKMVGVRPETSLLQRIHKIACLIQFSPFRVYAWMTWCEEHDKRIQTYLAKIKSRQDAGEEPGPASEDDELMDGLVFTGTTESLAPLKTDMSADEVDRQLTYLDGLVFTGPIGPVEPLKSDVSADELARELAYIDAIS